MYEKNRDENISNNFKNCQFLISLFSINAYKTLERGEKMMKKNK
jgi:hypothetical protein